MPSARSKKPLPPVSDEALSLIASWFRTLAEPSRLKILRALEEGGELNISELVEATGLTQANVSRHVQSLADEAQCLEPPFSVVLAPVFNDQGTGPIEVRRRLEPDAALG